MSVNFQKFIDVWSICNEFSQTFSSQILNVLFCSLAKTYWICNALTTNVTINDDQDQHFTCADNIRRETFKLITISKGYQRRHHQLVAFIVIQISRFLFEELELHFSNVNPCITFLPPIKHLNSSEKRYQNNILQIVKDEAFKKFLFRF